MSKRDLEQLELLQKLKLKEEEYNKVRRVPIADIKLNYGLELTIDHRPSYYTHDMPVKELILTLSNIDGSLACVEQINTYDFEDLNLLEFKVKDMYYKALRVIVDTQIREGDLIERIVQCKTL